MAKENKERPGILGSFLGGLILTMILVIAVPVVVSYFIEPIIMDLVADMEISNSIVQLSSGAIGGIVMFIIMILFMMLLGGGSILKKYGVIGIIGLIVAYWAMGDIYGAVVPIIIVVVLGLISYLRDR